jgi:hypothetical protein
MNMGFFGEQALGANPDFNGGLAGLGQINLNQGL